MDWEESSLLSVRAGLKGLSVLQVLCAALAEEFINNFRQGTFSWLEIAF